MSYVVIKYNQSVGCSGQINGYVKSVQNVIIVSIVTKTYTRKTPPNTNNDDDTNHKRLKKYSSPLITHWISKEDIKYKLDKTLTYSCVKLHYCKTSTYLNKLRWHTHHLSNYRLRICYLQKLLDAAMKNLGNDTSVISTVPNPGNIPAAIHISDSSSNSSSLTQTSGQIDIISLLSQTMNTNGDNEVV